MAWLVSSVGSAAEVFGGPLSSDAAQARAYRSAAARISYLAQDRLDIQYASKEACCPMARPRSSDWSRILGIARYLPVRPRMTWWFHYQPVPMTLVAVTDSDWGGHAKTARSTSGGVVMHGRHAVRTWSSTQKHITLSSCEAEPMGITRRATEGLGLQQI